MLREVEEALQDGKASTEDLESRFAALEGKGGSASDEVKGGSAVDDELAALKKKIRIGG